MKKRKKSGKGPVEKADRDMKAHQLTAEYYRAGNAFNTLIYQINQIFKFYCLEPGKTVSSNKGTDAADAVKLS